LASSKAALKAIRSSAKKQDRNKSIRTVCKSKVTKARNLAASGELDKAKEAVVEAISTLDKATGKGILHPNNAARRKSRLMKRFNKAQAAPAEAAK
jgi:small subunit ribosomal protein S20